MATTTKKQRPKKRMTRKELVDSICGKYRFVRTSSEKFAREKQREIRREDRVR